MDTWLADHEVFYDEVLKKTRLDNKCWYC